jgi:cyclase
MEQLRHCNFARRNTIRFIYFENAPEDEKGMRIAAIKSTLLACATVALLSVSASGQGAYQAVDKVDTIPVDMLSIRTTKVTDNFHVLTGIAPAPKGYNVPNGRYGGQIGVLSGPDGIFMVDGQYPPTNITQKVLAAIRQFSNDPIKFMVLTHVHVDHVGGNEAWANMGVTIMSQEPLRYELAHQKGYPAGGVPKISYRGPVSYYMNGETIEIYPLKPAHTDGDSIVKFVNADVIMMGDFYRASYPNIRGGGSLDGIIDALGFAIGLGGPTTKFVPGHGPFGTRADVIEYRDMVRTVRDRVAKLVSEGKTQDEIIAAKITSDYDAKVLKDVASFYDDGTLAGYANAENRFLKQAYDQFKCLQDGGMLMVETACRGK